MAKKKNQPDGIEFRKSHKKIHDQDWFQGLALLLPYALLFSAFILAPVAIAMGLSFYYFDVVNTPEPAGLANYLTLFTGDVVFMKYVLPNTITYALIVGVFGYILQFLMAWVLAQVTPRARTLYALALYTPSLTGQLMITIIWKTLFNGDQNGIINSYLMRFGFIDQPIQWLLSSDYFMQIMIIVSLWSSMGIGFLSMLSGILNIDQELYEAAYVDGLRNRLQEIIYITVPSMKPQMLFGAVMAIVNAFNVGWIGVNLAGANPTPGYAGQLIANHIDDYALLRYEMGYASAISVVMLILVWLCSQIANKLFTEKEDF
ncbi:MAG: sugar ABC transporter permease [Lachnospiraceae bacterium]|nr:sugar ABC transporter permease [Lachnospiraceae bacterium]